MTANMPIMFARSLGLPDRSFLFFPLTGAELGAPLPLDHRLRFGMLPALRVARGDLFA